MGSRVFEQKRLILKPPDKGSFPLDHEGDCKRFMHKYLLCMVKSDDESSQCRQLAKDYLQCRMDKNLMTKEDWSSLGFAEDSNVSKEQ